MVKKKNGRTFPLKIKYERGISVNHAPKLVKLPSEI